MNKHKEKNGKYFQDALSDFVYDAASGKAIRHLADAGYTAAQIVQQLDYPTSFAKVQHTVTRYLKETGILLEELPIPPADLQPVILKRVSPETLFPFLVQRIHENGEENSYVSCAFDAVCSQSKHLTTRELEYIKGILWEPKIMYHRLNRRMLEIAVQIAVHSKEVQFHFLKSGETFI